MLEQDNNNDYASVLQTYKGRPTPSVSAEDFRGSDFGLTPEQEADYNQFQEKYKPVTPALDTRDYYPNIGEPIGVGTSSGRIIGSQTQYVPGGAVVPIGMWDARDAAIQKAAAQKLKDVEEWKSRNMAKAPTSDLTSINDALRENFFKHQQESWQSAIRKTKGDASKASFLLQNDPEYQAKNKAFYDQAKLGTTAFKHIQDVEDRQAKGEVITEPLKQLTDKLLRTQDPSTDEFKNSANIIQTMGPVKDMNDVFNKGISQMKMDQSSSSWIGDKGDYITENERGEQFYSPEAIKRQKEMMYNHYGLGPNGESKGGYVDPYFNKEKIDAFVDGAMGAKIKTSKINAQFKPKDEGEIEDLKIDNISDEIGSINGMVARGQYEGTKEVANAPARQGLYSQLDGMTLKKPVEVVIPTSADITDLSTGSHSTSTKNRKAMLGGIYNAYTYKGMMIDDNSPLWKTNKKDIKVTPMASVVFEEQVPKKDKSGYDKVQVSGQMPLSQVKNAILGKNNKNKEFFDEYYKRAEQRQAELNKGQETKTAKYNPGQQSKFPLPKGKPRIVKQNGYTYTWNENTGQYE